MSNFYTEKEIHTIEDANGDTTTYTTEKTKSINCNPEPDYVKIYTKMWCEFNEIPLAYRNLFIQLAQRMTYANLDSYGNSNDNGGQIVYTGKPVAQTLMEACGWKSEVMLRKGLQALCKCNAIRRVGRGVYQVNPSYAGRGLWKYSAMKEQGGIENLIATFNFKTKSVKTQVVYASADADVIGDDFDSVISTRTDIKDINSKAEESLGIHFSDSGDDSQESNNEN